MTTNINKLISLIESMYGVSARSAKFYAEAMDLIIKDVSHGKISVKRLKEFVNYDSRVSEQLNENFSNVGGLISIGAINSISRNRNITTRINQYDEVKIVNEHRIDTNLYTKVKEHLKLGGGALIVTELSNDGAYVTGNIRRGTIWVPLSVLKKK